MKSLLIAASILALMACGGKSTKVADTAVAVDPLPPPPVTVVDTPKNSKGEKQQGQNNEKQQGKKHSKNQQGNN